MRNPIRLKNFSARLAPWYALGGVLLIVGDVGWTAIAAGSLPIAAGLALRAWGCGYLVKNERFTVTGPYAYVRHPLYLGTIAIGLGFASMLGGWLGVAAGGGLLLWFGLTYFPRKERVESARLESRYGEIYRRYRDQVPALLPRLDAWTPPAADARKIGADVAWSFERYDENNELGTMLAVAAGMAAVAVRASLG